MAITHSAIDTYDKASFSFTKGPYDGAAMIEIKHSTIMHFCILIVRACVLVICTDFTVTFALCVIVVGDDDILVLFFSKFCDMCIIM